jgi:ABC-type sulfate transport system permease component
MIKTRIISPYNDFKTGFFSKLFIIAGIILIIFYILSSLLSYFEHILGSILAFSILCIGLGFIFYFMSLQFAKLAQIAKEIEMEEDQDCNQKTQ